MSEVTLSCQHCDVTMGSYEVELDTFPKYCPYCGERVMPTIEGRADE